MRRYRYLLPSIAVVMAMLLPARPSGAGEAAAATLVDQHWSITGLDPQRMIELRVLVVNNTSSPLTYHVKFTAEWSEAAALAAPVGEAPNKTTGEARGEAGGETQGKTAGEAQGKAAAVQWKPVQILVVHGGPLTAGASETVAEKLPADILQAPKAYRFHAELLDGSSGARLAETFVTKRSDPAAAKWLPAAALAAILTGGGSGSSHGDPGPWTGSGTMVGTHEAQRVGSEWVEHGSGVITVTGRDFQMVIDYTYDSHGPNAAALSAVGTGVGTISRPGRAPLAVHITSATAQMSAAGDRRQSGNVVTRTNCAATGTFDGTAGDDPYRGTITMTNGTQTLDLVTHKGEHRYDIQFTAAR